MIEIGPALRTHRLARMLAVCVLAGAASGCGSSSQPTSAPGVSCTNYPIHASGKYRDEVAVQVAVSNATSSPARFVVTVDLASSKAPGDGTATQVTIYGLVASHSSAELSRKVLTTGPVQRCRITKLGRS